MKTLRTILHRSDVRLARRYDVGTALVLIATVFALVACGPGTSASTAPPVAKNGKLYGDSIMRAFPVAEMMMYLPAGSSAGNVGVDGQTLRQAELGEYAQSGKSFATDMAAATDVQYVVAAWGTNDANRDRMSPEVFVQTLARMRASAPGKVFIVETAGPISVPEPAQSLVAEYTRLTKEAAIKNNWFVCDTAAEVVRLFPSWFSDVGIAFDGLHPSGTIQSAKAAVLAKCILEATK